MKIIRNILATTFFISTALLTGYGQMGIKAIPKFSVQPDVITDSVKWDTDDPSIWINSENRNNSLIIGTDKHTDGALYAFNMKGKIVKRVGYLQRPNNVDIAYGFLINGKRTDIAIVTEREAQRLRVFSLPDLEPIDRGDLIVFGGNSERAPMGIAIYKRPKDDAFFVFVGGKSGPQNNYLAQYSLQTDSAGNLKIEAIREFGRYSGKKEIESIAVDTELGYLYYSDEQVGIRKYYADAEKGNEELALFGQGEFKEDNEGISIYKFGDGLGYILVSDQSANRFNIYPREGSKGHPNLHKRIASISVSTIQSDGSDVTSVSLPGFTKGLFVAMSTDKTFHYYNWSAIAKKARLRIK